MSNDLEIYLQDKMMNGHIEASRAEIFIPPNVVSHQTSYPTSSSSKSANKQVVVSELLPEDSRLDGGGNQFNPNTKSQPPPGLLISSRLVEKPKKWRMFTGTISDSKAMIVYAISNKLTWKDFKFGEWYPDSNAVYNWDNEESKNRDPTRKGLRLETEEKYCYNSLSSVKSSCIMS